MTRKNITLALTALLFSCSQSSSIAAFFKAGAKMVSAICSGPQARRAFLQRTAEKRRLMADKSVAFGNRMGCATLCAGVATLGGSVALDRYDASNKVCSSSTKTMLSQLALFGSWPVAAGACACGVMSAAAFTNPFGAAAVVGSGLFAGAAGAYAYCRQDSTKTVEKR